MRIEDFLQDKTVSLEVRMGTLLASGMSFGDLNFVIYAEILLEEAEENEKRSTDLCVRLEKAKRNREIKIKKISQN